MSFREGPTIRLLEAHPDLRQGLDAQQAAAAAPMPNLLRTPARLVLSALIGRVRVPDPVTAMLNRTMPANSLVGR